MANAKFTYFDAKGIGETIRILLHYNGIDFEDIRIADADWPKLKPHTPFGQIPSYEENGKVAWQSTAIMRYLGRKGNLAGDTEWENLQVDAIVDTITDVQSKVNSLYFEPDLEKKAKAIQLAVSEQFPFYFDRFEKLTTQNKGYLALDRLTWADIYFVNAVAVMEAIVKENIIDKYTNLKRLIQTVEEDPKIKEWIEKRPKTEY